MATATAPARKDIRDSKVRYTLWRMWRERSAYAFLAPGFIIFAVFTVAALIYAFWLTFHRWSIIEADKPYVGLDNYQYMIHDPKYRTAIFNTAYFTLGSVPVSMAIGLFFAVLLNQPIKLRGLFRTMYFLPVVTPFVVTAILWKWLYNGDFGLFNYYLLKFHIIDDPLLWLSSKNLAMPAVILMAIWGGTGFSMVIYLAGLQAIPAELYESARMDGAGAFQRFWYITLPMLSPTSLFLLVIGIIGSFQIFTQIYIMTSGGPVDRTTTVVYYIYEWIFKLYDLGYASTLAFGLFVLLLGVTIMQLRMYRRVDV